MHHRRYLLLVAIAFVSTACSGATSPAPSSASTAAVTMPASPAASPSAAPSSAPSPSALAQVQTVQDVKGDAVMTGGEAPGYLDMLGARRRAPGRFLCLHAGAGLGPATHTRCARGRGRSRLVILCRPGSDAVPARLSDEDGPDAMRSHRAHALGREGARRDGLRPAPPGRRERGDDNNPRTRLPTDPRFRSRYRPASLAWPRASGGRRSPRSWASSGPTSSTTWTPPGRRPGPRTSWGTHRLRFRGRTAVGRGQPEAVLVHMAAVPNPSRFLVRGRPPHGRLAIPGGRRQPPGDGRPGEPRALRARACTCPARS